MEAETLRLFAIAKLPWIRQQQRKILQQEREPEREYLDLESHYVWGKRYLLSVLERDLTPKVELQHRRLVLTIRPGTNQAKREQMLEAWYRQQVKLATPSLITKWEPKLAVKVARLFVQRMRTRWGSCNPKVGNIRLNTDLAKKPRECLEYIVLHEMVHLLEPTHNERFVGLMDRWMPNWKTFRETLNRLPLRHEDWQY
jgi:predicted metal-dependent hydrolase